MLLRLWTPLWKPGREQSQMYFSKPSEAPWFCWRLSSFDFYQFFDAGNPSIEHRLVLSWRYVPEVAVEAFSVVPVHPSERGKFEIIDRFPRPRLGWPAHKLGLVITV